MEPTEKGCRNATQEEKGKGWVKQETMLTSDIHELWPAAKLNVWWAISEDQPQLGCSEIDEGRLRKYLHQTRSFKAVIRYWTAGFFWPSQKNVFLLQNHLQYEAGKVRLKLWKMNVKMFWEEPPQLYQAVNKRPPPQLQHTISAPQSLQLLWRVAAHQVAEQTTEVLLIGSKEERVFFQPWWLAARSLGGPHQHPGRVDAAGGRHTVRGSTGEITSPTTHLGDSAWTVVSWLPRSIWGSLKLSLAEYGESISNSIEF